MQGINKQILSRIFGRGRGWVFSSADFVVEFPAANIDKALSILTKEGKIRRLCRGLYHYPNKSALLGQEMGPDMDQVAQAFARKFNWRIQPTGDTALNLLGLSTQVPAKYLYASDGPNRTYKISGIFLEFRRTALKDVGFRYRESGLIVHALKALGRDHARASVREHIRQQLTPDLYEKIVSDTRTVTGWVHDIIKDICRESG